LDGIIQILVRKLEIKNKKKIFEFLLLPHGVILAFKNSNNARFWLPIHINEKWV